MASPLPPPGRGTRDRHPTGHWPGMTIVLLLASALAVLAMSSLVSGDGTSVVYTKQVTELTLVSAGAASDIMERVVDGYTVIRGATVHLTHQKVTNTATPSVSPASLAWEQLRRGDADFALIPFEPSDQQKMDEPDLMYQPFFAVGFGIVVNMPESDGDFVLSVPLLARIFLGNITTWNHPAILALNGASALPNKPIEIVLPAEAQSFIRQFTQDLGGVDAEFAAATPVSAYPNWQTQRFAKFVRVSETQGPASYVLDHPYSIGVALIGQAEQLQVPLASLVNHHGTVVRPTFIGVSAALNERVVKSSLVDGALVYSYNFDLTLASGVMSWPFVQIVTLVIPRLFAGSTCVARSEIVKFLLWMKHNDAIKNTLLGDAYAALTSNEVDLLLHGDDTLLALMCEDAPVEGGQTHPVYVSGSIPQSIRPNVYELLLEIISDADTTTNYVFESSQNEAQDLSQLSSQDAIRDVLFFAPLIVERTNPEVFRAHVEADDVRLLHNAIHAVVPTFNLPLAIQPWLVLNDDLADDSTSLLLDMETVAGIFLGQITSWEHPKILARNSNLVQAFARARNASAFGVTSLVVDSVITLVVAGVGDPADSPRSGISNHLLLAIMETAAYASSGIDITFPANWTAMADRAQANGGRCIIVAGEIQMESAMSNYPGSISVILSSSDIATPTTQFAIVKPYILPDGTSGLSTVFATPASLLELAAHSEPTSDASFVLTAARSQAYELRHGYPIPYLLSMAIPKDMSSAGSQYDSTTVCFRQLRALNLATYFTQNEQVIAPSAKAGRAAVQNLPAWKDFFWLTIRGCTCDGAPALYKEPIIWSVPNNIYTFVLVVAALGAALVCACAYLVIKYRTRSIIGSASIPLQSTELVGCLLLLVSSVLFVTKATDSRCVALGWTSMMGVAATAAPLCVKIFKVYHLASQKKTIVRKRLTTHQLYLITGVWLAVHILVLIIAETRGGLLQPSTSSSVGSGGVEHLYTQCYVPMETLPHVAVLFGGDFLALVVTSVLAFTIRHVSSAFQESRDISHAVWNTVLSTVIIVPLMIFTGGVFGDVGAFLVAFLLLWITFATLICTFVVSKAWSLLWEAVTLARERARNSQMSRTGSRTSGHTSAGTYSGTGTGTSGIASLFSMPVLDAVGLHMLEKYIFALETHLRLAKEKRRQLFGADSAVSYGGGEGAAASHAGDDHAYAEGLYGRVRSSRDAGERTITSKPAHVHPAADQRKVLKPRILLSPSNNGTPVPALEAKEEFFAHQPVASDWPDLARSESFSVRISHAPAGSPIHMPTNATAGGGGPTASPTGAGARQPLHIRSDSLEAPSSWSAKPPGHMRKNSPPAILTSFGPGPGASSSSPPASPSPNSGSSKSPPAPPSPHSVLGASSPPQSKRTPILITAKLG